MEHVQAILEKHLPQSSALVVWKHEENMRRKHSNRNEYFCDE